MNWLFGREMKHPEWVEQFEKKVNYRFPEDYRNIVLKRDRAIPERAFFDVGDLEGCAMVCLLSFDPEDAASVWDEGDFGEEAERLAQYVGFACESGGDQICFDKKDDSVVYLDHETLEVERIAPSFQAFLDMLRENF